MTKRTTSRALLMAAMALLGTAGLNAQSLDAQSVTMGRDGGAWALNLTAPGAWTASANSSFLHIAGNAAGVGNAVVLFSADPWTGTANRTGSLTVAGLTVTVTQLPARARVFGSARLFSIGPVLNSTIAPLVAADASGNVFYSDLLTGVIDEWNGATRKTSTIVVTTSTPGALATDSSGDVYVTNLSSNSLYKWVPGGTAKPAALLNGNTLSAPAGLAFDPRGVGGTLPLLHIVNGGSSVLGWNPAATPATIVETSGLVQPLAVSYGPFGVVVASSSGYLSTTGGTLITTALYNSVPINALAQDSAAIYFNRNGQGIGKFIPSTQQVIWLFYGNTSSMAMDGNGDLVFRDNTGVGKLNVGAPAESLGTTSLTVGAAGGSQSVGIDFTQGYFAAPWSASTAATWLHLTNTSGKGPSTLLFTVDANPAASPRSANIVLDSGLVLTVTQAGTNYTGVHSLATLLSGISGRGLALDGAANLYLANYGANAVDVWNASTQLLTPVVTSGLNIPGGVALDGAGNLYIADTGDNAVKKWSGSALATLVSGLNQPYGVAVDAPGNVYFSDQLNDVIKQWTPATGAVTTLASGLNLPAGVAVDGSGDIYFADRANNAIKMWSSATQTVTTLISTGLTSPYAVAVDGARNLYIGDAASPIKVWSAATQQIANLGPAQTGYGAAVDRLGGVYASAGATSVLKLTSAFVNPAAVAEPAAAVTDTLPPVLPAGTPLNGVLAPQSDQSWLTIGPIANGLVSFSLAANATGAARTAHITLLGQSIAVTQSNITLKAQAGSTPQSAAGNTAFANPLAVVVTNGAGVAVAGVNVAFTAPSSGASGKFANGAASITVASNSSGVASAPFTANATGGQYTVTASAGGQTVAFVLENSGEPTSIAANAGATPQSAAVASAYVPLAATVRDILGNPLSGISVTFTAPASGASGKFGNGAAAIAVATNSAGVASAPFTANTVAGAYTVTAAVAGASLTAGFSLTNNPGPPASIVPGPGATPQSVALGGTYSLPITVRDAYGNPVPWLPVVFADASWQALFGGSSQATYYTGPPNGAVTATATAYGSPGKFTLTATAGSAMATFALTNLGGPAYMLTNGAHSAPPSTAFSTPLNVTVTDSAGDPLAGVAVTLTAPASGPSGVFSNGTNTIALVTNASGLASATFTSNALIGSYSVTAATAGVANVGLPMSNHGPAAHLTVSPNSSWQWAEISTPFLTPLAVTVTDSAGNVVSGVTVNFSAPASGPSGTFGNNTTAIAAVTDGSGAVSVPFTANAIQSTGAAYFVSATSGALGGSIALTNVGKPASIGVEWGLPQDVHLNGIAVFAVEVSDSQPHGVPGAVVTFTTPTSGPSGVFKNGSNTISVTCDHNGFCETGITANGTLGTYNVTVSSPGVPNLIGQLTNVPAIGPPASIAANAGSTPQATRISTAFPVQLAVTVKDANGYAIPRVNVSFTAPASGASGTFANGSYASTATTDANGAAYLPFTANATAGSYVVTAAIPGLPVVNFQLTNSSAPAPGAPANIVVNPASTWQWAEISTPFTPLAVTVTDAKGIAVPGATVTFSAPASGPSGIFSNGATKISAVTNAAGVASVPFTANAIPSTGSQYYVSATSGTLGAVIALTNVGVPASISANGFPVTVQINSGVRIGAQVNDAQPHGVPGASLTFTAPASGPSGVFSNGATSITVPCDQYGQCQTTLTANGAVGSFSVTVSSSSPGVPSVRGQVTIVGHPASMTAVAGSSPQSAQVLTAFPAQLAVKVTDSYGNPVPGVAVSFAAPAYGPSGTFAGGTNVQSGSTDATGVASVPFTANATTGSYVVAATATGLPTVNFALTNHN